MKQGIGKFLASIRQLLLAARMERRIRRRILPHLSQGVDYGYPFKSRDEMVRSYMHAALDIERDLSNILRTAADMPQPYGDMFCYIAYCDLHERLAMYQKVAEKLVQSTASESQCVAVPT